MYKNDQMLALEERGACTFDEIEFDSVRLPVVTFSDGRRNVLPYDGATLRHSRWMDMTQDLGLLGRLTQPDALAAVETTIAGVIAALPEARVSVDSFGRGPDRPVRFKVRAGSVTVRGGFPIRHVDAGAEVARVVAAHEAAVKAIAGEISSWRATTMDACYVAVAAGLSGLTGDEFFAAITRDPQTAQAIVDVVGNCVVSAPAKETSLPSGLSVRVQGRTVTATMKTRAYTFDACRLIVKDAPALPETMITAARGQTLDRLVAIPGLDGADLVVKSLKCQPAGKKLQMTIHFMSKPLRLAAAREMYDAIHARRGAAESSDAEEEACDA